MPDLDHDVHESVKSTGQEPYGCATAQQKDGYIVQVREYKNDGTYVMRDKFVKHRMSKPCRNFYLWYSDPRCSRCKRQKDREYAQTMMHM